MNILTTPYRRSQLIALPMPGGKAKVEYCYAVNIPGDRPVVSHEFTEWAVGDWRREVEAQLCATSIGISETNTESLFGLSAGSQKATALSTSEKLRDISPSALALSTDSCNISQR